MEYEKNFEWDVYFFDRGIPDAIGFFNFDGLNAPKEILDACTLYPYDQHVFIVPPWEEIYQSDNVRNYSYEDAVKQHIGIVKAYKELGYQIIILPKVTIKERVDFILNNYID